MIIIRELGLQSYQTVWEQMKQFTLSRNAQTQDECWLLQHHPVYTQGLAGKAEHLLHPGAVPVIKSDRGGQVTYHGPGQLVAYFLIDLHRRKTGIRSLVTHLEQILISLLADYDIHAVRRCGAPGVYVNEQKIASLGLRVKNGCTYHGVALNVTMDLNPFSGINPCGYSGLRMTQMSDFISDLSVHEVSERLKGFILKQF